MNDAIGHIAHLFTGCINRTCCHRTGGYGSDPACDCRAIAETIIEDFPKIAALVGPEASASSTRKEP